MSTALAQDAPKASIKAEESNTRIAPDPFAAVLPALAALGAIASIAAVNWVAQERTPDRTRTKRRAADAGSRELLHGPAGRLPSLSA